MMNKDGETLIPPDQQVLQYNLTRILNSPGLKLPDSYAVFDLETTGLQPNNASIWQIGLYPVIAGEPRCDAKNGQCSVKVKLPEDELRRATFEISRRRAKKMGLSLSKVALEKAAKEKDGMYKEAEAEFISSIYDDKNSVPLDEALKYLTSILSTFIDNGWPLVGQNFAKFDMPFIEYAVGALGIPFKFSPNNLIDTGMLIKAAVLKLMMKHDENARNFYLRVYEMYARGVYYALDRFCIPYWDMEKRHGISADSAHDAGYDAYITSLVMWELVNECNKNPEEIAAR